MKESLGSFQVLWEAGWLTAAQSHSLLLRLTVTSSTVVLVKLVDVRVHKKKKKKVPFNPA